MHPMRIPATHAWLTRLRNAAAAPMFCSALTLMMRGVLAYPGCLEAVMRALADGGTDPLLASADGCCMEPSLLLGLAGEPGVSSRLPLIEAIDEAATDTTTSR